MFLTILFVTVVTIYLFLKYIFSYWWRKGFAYIKPEIPLGNMGATVKGKTSFGLNIWDHYKASDSPFTGIYLFTTPSLLIRDPDLVRKILINNNQSFYDRGLRCNSECDILSENLFTLPGARWKNLRNKLSPTFTSGKLKAMMPTILDIGRKQQNYLMEKAQNNEIVEMKDAALRYTLDIISNVIFGYEINSFTESDNQFRTFHKRVNNPTFFENIKTAMSFLCPQ